MMSWTSVARLFGTIVFGFSTTLVLPMIWAVVYQEWGSLLSFGVTMALTWLLAFVLRIYGRSGDDAHIFRREALTVVGLSWFVLPAMGALPFLLDGVFTSPVDALFESVSGFTTTGATVLTEIETAMSRSTHFWRMMTHWLGGMGIMVLFVAVLPSLGVGGKMLFKNEVPGPITESLKPRIRETSVALWRIYIGLTVAQTILLATVGGMDLWNASAHAMSTLGTGGFSTLNSSVAGFDSVAVDVIITVFMFLAGVNFSLYFLALGGKWRTALRDIELWAYAGITLAATAIVSIAILERHGHQPLQAIRYGAFQVVAIVTTTGFGTDDFDQYPALARNLLFFLLFVGGSAGSTAGGMKVFRYIVLAKAAWRQVSRTFRPQSVSVVKIRNQAIGDDTVAAIQAFFFAYLGLFVFGAMAMSLMTPDLETAISSSIACLGNVGPGLSMVGPTQNYAFIPAPGKLLLTVLMVFGRLEVYTLLVLFAPSFWRR